MGSVIEAFKFLNERQIWTFACHRAVCARLLFLANMTSTPGQELSKSETHLGQFFAGVSSCLEPKGMQDTGLVGSFLRLWAIVLRNLWLAGSRAISKIDIGDYTGMV